MIASHTLDDTESVPVHVIQNQPAVQSVRELMIISILTHSQDAVKEVIK